MLYRDTSSYPQCTAYAQQRIFEQTEARIEMRLDRGFVVFPCGKASCRTVVGFPDSQVAAACCPLLFGQIPDAAFCVAEAGERTIFLIIGQRDFGSVDLFRILEKRTGRGREGRVPVGVFVRTVAIRLVAGMAGSDTAP